MAKSKKTATATQVAAEPAEIAPPASPQPTEATAPQRPEIVSSQDRPKGEQRPRPLMPDPFPFKTVNLGGYKVHFQHSKQSGEFQIRFGDGIKDDMPPDSIRDFVKSHKVEVESKDGEKKTVQLFHWNDNDRAWGMRIPYDREATEEQNKEARETARQRAKNIFDEVVAEVAEDRRKRRAAEPDSRQAGGSPDR
jgi:hypothetical protein